MISKYCADCGIKLTGHGKPVRCGACATKNRWASSEARDRASIAAKKRYENPEQKRLTSEKTRRAWENPEIRNRMETALQDACNNGKHLNDVARVKMSRAAKKAMTPKRKRSISKQQKERWADPTYRKNHSSSIKVAWENGAYDNRDCIEYRNKLSVALKRAHANGKFDSVARDNYFISSIERMVWESLESFGVEFRKQYRPLGCTYIYDVYIPCLELLLEVDGDYWHYSENAVKYGMVERDALKSKWAYDHGFNLARVRESDIKSLGVGTALIAVLPEEVVGDSWQKEGL